MRWNLAYRTLLDDHGRLIADDYASVSIHFWMVRTGFGLSFGAATLGVPLMLYVGCGVLIDATCVFAAGLPYLPVRRIDPHSALQS